MTVWFVSRHPGAIQWAKGRGLAIDRWETHLDPSWIRAGDCVIGSLPMALAAAVCQVGARYFALDLTVTADMRGRELSTEELDRIHCDMHEYVIRAVDADWRSDLLR